MSAHDWTQFKQSQGRGCSHWLVIEERDDGWQVEALVIEGKPVIVRLVLIGPRGGVWVAACGSGAYLEDEIDVRHNLLRVARDLDARLAAL